MMRLSVLLVFLLGCATCVMSRQRCCSGVAECFNDNPPFNDMPLPRCKKDIKPYAKLWTRGGGAKGEPVDENNIPGSFSGSRPRTVFIVHGFLNQGNMHWMEDMRKAILQKEDANVLQFGWENGAQTIDYPQAASNTRLVGAFMARIARALNTKRGADPMTMWCIGHSLGGHLCGHAGARLKLGRITALDPAGPLFDDTDIKAGLNPSCANYVDVLHTMGKKGVLLDFGTLRPLGHADFYPNGGTVQPGCINYRLQGYNPKAVAPYIDLDPTCSHHRCLDLFLESLRGSCTFWARRRCSNEKKLPGSCISCGDRCAIMGYRSDTIRAQGKFYLTTNDDTPYCRG